MNEIDTLVNHLPTKYMAVGTFVWVLIQSLGRAWFAWKNAGGWYGVRHALLYGTNTITGTTQKESNSDESKKIS